MKRLTLLLLLVSSTVLAQGYSFEKYERESYFATSYSFDVVNAFIGGKKNEQGVRRNPKALDLVGRAMFGFDHLEFAFSFEIFDEINYYSIGVDVNYVQPILKEKLIGIIGVQADLVERYGLEEIPEFKTLATYFNPSINARLRSEGLFGTNFFAEAQLRYLRRNDIKNLWGRLPSVKESMNGYLGIGYKF